LEERGIAARDGVLLTLTEEGRRVAAKLVEARRESLARLLGDWKPEEHTELAELVDRLSGELCGDDADRPQPRTTARPGV
jgi:DNA-binding MarR family transcriptional regulator